MVTDERTSRVLEQAKQHRAEAIGKLLTSYPVAVVSLVAVVMLLTAIDWGASPNATTASLETGQVTDVGKR